MKLDVRIFLQKSLCVHDHWTMISTFCNFLLIPHSLVKAVAQASMVLPLHTLNIFVDQCKKISLDQKKNIYVDQQVMRSNHRLVCLLRTQKPEVMPTAKTMKCLSIRTWNTNNIEEKLKTKLKRNSELYYQNLISTEKSGLLELVGQSGQSKDLSQLRETVGQQKGNR